MLVAIKEALRQALTPEVTPEVPCKTDPRAPHGFDRNASVIVLIRYASASVKEC
jgi:hypothetical protein